MSHPSQWRAGLWHAEDEYIETVTNECFQHCFANHYENALELQRLLADADVAKLLGTTGKGEGTEGLGTEGSLTLTSLSEGQPSAAQTYENTRRIVEYLLGSRRFNPQLAFVGDRASKSSPSAVSIALITDPAEL